MPVTGSPGSPQAVGVQNQLGKVSATPTTQAGVFGPHNRRDPHDTDLTRGGAEDPEGVPIDSSQGQSVSEGLVETNWHDVGDNAGSLAGPNALQRTPGSEDKNTEDNTVLLDYGAFEQGFESRTRVVDSNAQQMEWSLNSTSGPQMSP